MHPPLDGMRHVLGNSLQFLRDSYGLQRDAMDRVGDVYSVSVLGHRRVMLQGADALEFVLGDRDGLFSSLEGWDVLDRLFPGGLMLRDFDDHRRHRRVMQSAFRAPAMRSYLVRMEIEIDRLLGGWPTERRFAFASAAKDMTLRMGGAVFMGLPSDDPDAERVNRAFSDEIAASMSLVRRPLPFTKFGRGLRARRALTERFGGLIAERRGGEGARGTTSSPSSAAPPTTTAAAGPTRRSSTTSTSSSSPPTTRRRRR